MRFCTIRWDCGRLRSVHELGIALEVIEHARRAAEGARITEVVVEVGQLTAVLPDALQFSWELACRGTALDGARLRIDQVPARARCRVCQRESEPARIVDACPCGSYELDWIAGDELRIRELEVM